MNKGGSKKVVTDDQYERGFTPLTESQVDLLERISLLLNGYRDNYENLPRAYAPRGLVDVLHHQILAKLQSNDIDHQTALAARSLIGELKRQIQ